MLVRIAALFMLAGLVVWISPKAEAQYYGYLPLQTGGCEQTTVTVPSGSWFTYIIRQRDMDTVLVGYPPQQMQVADPTCAIVCTAWRSGWQRIEITLSEVTQDNTLRWQVETRAKNVNTRTTFYDTFVLYNARLDTDVYKDPWLEVSQRVVVEP